MTLTVEQLALRATGIGASEIGAVCGLSPYRTPMDVYLDKTGQAPPRDEDVLRWGNLLEPVIGAEYARRNEVALVPGTTERHPAFEWALATPDYLVDARPPMGLEIKCRRADARWEDGPPAEVLAQAQWGMFVLSYTRWDVAVLFGGTEYRQYRVARDDTFIAQLKEIGRVFWRDHVEPRVPPPSLRSGDAKRRFPSVTEPSVVAASTQQEFLMQRYLALRDTMREHEDELDGVRAQLMDAVGAHAVMTGHRAQASWAMVRAGVDWEACARSLGATDKDEVEYRKAPFRRFLVRARVRDKQ